MCFDPQRCLFRIRKGQAKSLNLAWSASPFEHNKHHRMTSSIHGSRRYAIFHFSIIKQKEPFYHLQRHFQVAWSFNGQHNFVSEGHLSPKSTYRAMRRDLLAIDSGNNPEYGYLLLFRLDTFCILYWTPYNNPGLQFTHNGAYLIQHIAFWRQRIVWIPRTLNSWVPSDISFLIFLQSINSNRFEYWYPVILHCLIISFRRRHHRIFYNAGAKRWLHEPSLPYRICSNEGWKWNPSNPFVCLRLRHLIGVVWTNSQKMWQVEIARNIFRLVES